MNFSISEMAATVYNCHKGYEAHGIKTSEGSFGKATSIAPDGIFVKAASVRVELADPALTIIIREDGANFVASFKGIEKSDENLEEAIFESLDAGNAFSVTKF